jgi:hypothetical protein
MDDKPSTFKLVTNGYALVEKYKNGQIPARRAVDYVSLCAVIQQDPSIESIGNVLFAVYQMGRFDVMEEIDQ